MLIRRACSCVAGAFLFAGTWPPACQANEDTAEYERYKQRRQIEGRLFTTGLHRFGNQLRAGAIAAACDKKELVDSLGPSPEDVASFFVSEMTRNEGWNGKSQAFLQAITAEETIELALAVSDTLLVGYRSGYFDAAKAVKNDPMLCDVGLELADEILNESTNTK
jgi:hypothetical protein